MTTPKARDSAHLRRLLGLFFAVTLLARMRRDDARRLRCRGHARPARRKTACRHVAAPSRSLRRRKQVYNGALLLGRMWCAALSVQSEPRRRLAGQGSLRALDHQKVLRPQNPRTDAGVATRARHMGLECAREPVMWFWHVSNAEIRQIRSSRVLARDASCALADAWFAHASSETAPGDVHLVACSCITVQNASPMCLRRGWCARARHALCDWDSQSERA